MKILQISVLVFCLAVFINAQNAILEGTVYNAVGSGVPKVKISATNKKGKIFSTETNDEGDYTLPLFCNEIEIKASLNESKTVEFVINVDVIDQGVKYKVIKDFKFDLQDCSGKNFLSIDLKSFDPETCKTSGENCLKDYEKKGTSIPSENTKKITKKPLVTLPKARNRKRKN